MKSTLQLLFALALLISLTACGGAKNEEAETGEAEEVTEAEGGSAFDVNTENTRIGWRAYKITGDEHYGSFPVKNGEIKVEADEIVGGTFTFDIANLKVEDLEEDTEEHGKLTAHLKAPDFFDAEKYPEGKFTVTKVVAKAGENGTTHEVTGNLKIRNKENSITFPAVVEMGEDKIAVEAKTAIDRQKWDVNFNTPDAAIKDMVDIEIELEAGSSAS